MLHHLALTACDLETSGAFYDEVLRPLGYTRHHSSPKVCTWLCPQEGAAPEILIYAAKPDNKKNTHQTYDPGIHHIAFQTKERKTVDTVFKILKKLSAHIVDEPKEYPQYSKGYYAVFFLDPDGIKIEVAHIP